MAVHDGTAREIDEFGEKAEYFKCNLQEYDTLKIVCRHGVCCMPVPPMESERRISLSKRRRWTFETAVWGSASTLQRKAFCAIFINKFCYFYLCLVSLWTLYTSYRWPVVKATCPMGMLP